MKRPVKLLPDRVDKDGIAGFGKLIYALRPERHGKANEEHGFNQDHREFQMGGNAACYTFVIGHGMAAAVITEEYVNKETKPTDEKCAHEPMAKLDDMIDLIAVFGRVRRYTEEFVDQGKAIHIAINLLRPIARAVPSDGERNARDEN